MAVLQVYFRGWETTETI